MNKYFCVLITFCVLLLGAGIPGNGVNPASSPDGPGVKPDKKNVVEPYPYNPRIGDLNYELDGNKVKLTWKLHVPGEWIGIFRGKKAIGLLPGYLEEFEFEEEELGYFRYTVGINYSGQWVHSQDVLVNLGKLAWQHPNPAISGYYLYLGEADGTPEEVLPYDNPYDMSHAHDVFTFNEIHLSTLYNNGLLESGKTYYAATASYIESCPDLVISELTPAVAFTFHVNLDKPVP